MKTIIAVLLLLSGVAVAQSEPSLQTTIDFMNQMVKPDEGFFGLTGPKCEVKMVSFRRIDAWMFTSSNSFVTHDYSDVDEKDKNATYPKYTKFNLAEVDPTTIMSTTGGFSNDYVKRFFDQHADVCKGNVVNDKCEHWQLLAFDPKLFDVTVVAFHTADLKPAIERGGTTKIEQPGGTYYRDNPILFVAKTGIFFTDQDRAQRFVTAFTHAVKLCGGHASVFAPTPGKEPPQE